MTNPKDPQADIRRQVERLIIENRNSLNDPTTNEPYDVKGIADDVVELFQAHQQELLSELLGELPANPYSKRALDRRDEEMPKGKRIALENKGYGYKQALSEVVSVIERLQNKTNDGGRDGASE